MTPEPTREQLLAERDGILIHQHNVRGQLDAVSNLLRLRGRRHDRSKLRKEELPYFAAAAELRELKYGSKEYNALLKGSLQPALKHHYEHNRHHPEHFENGINGMNLVDMVEMLVDWSAAVQRHENPEEHNIFKSINYNRMRFRIFKQTAEILWNTAVDVLGEEPEDDYTMTIIVACVVCGEWQDPGNKCCCKCGEYNLHEV